MATTVDELLSQVRYAERLCQRTARLYRRLQTASTFLSIVGGGGLLSAVASASPAWAPVTGAVLLAVVGAANLAIRPADKASQNEADVKRYSALRARSVGMTFVDLSKALEEARMSDAPEVEPLRDVAWNDVVAELGYPEMREPLSLQQRVLAALA